MISDPNKTTAAASSPPPGPPSFKHMAWIPGGEFQMGYKDFYPEERPAHTVVVDGFWMDEHPVTNAEFRRFIKATGYRTVAEQVPPLRDPKSGKLRHVWAE